MAQLQNTQAQGFNEANSNPLGSFFPNYNHQTRAILQREVDKIMKRVWPELFVDMTALFQQTPLYKMSDEYEYFENRYDRVGVAVSGSTSSVFYPTTVTVPVATTDNIFTDMAVSVGGGKMGIVTSINTSGGTITLRPQTNDSIPALSAGDYLSFVTPVEGDGAKTINFRYRLSPTRRHNFIYLVSGMVEYTMLELQKYQNMNYINNFLNEEFENLTLHIRNSMSNMFWQGVKGEFILSDGRSAKMCEGINSFIDNGGVIVNTPVTSFGDAVEQAALASQYGKTGFTKFLFATPKNLSILQKQFKNLQTYRYTFPDSDANLKLNSYDFGSTKVVTVPFQRFADRTSFPAEYQDYAFLLDFNNIRPVKLTNWESTGQTAPRGQQQAVLTMSIQRWIADCLSTQNYNPQAHAKIILQ